MKNLFNETKINKLKWKLYHKWDSFVRFITLRSYFYDLLQTYVVEEIMITSVAVRHIDNPRVIIDFYESIIIQVVGSYLMIGVYENKKYYKVKHVVYNNGMGASVYVADVKNIENKPFLI